VTWSRGSNVAKKFEEQGLKGKGKVKNDCRKGYYSSWRTGSTFFCLGETEFVCVVCARVIACIGWELSSG
jgi:hypothetical protein